MYENIIKLPGCKKDIPITLSPSPPAPLPRGTGLTSEKILLLAEDAPYSSAILERELLSWCVMCSTSGDDDDVYDYIRWRLKLEGETESGVCMPTLVEREGWVLLKIPRCDIDGVGEGRC